MPVPHRILSTTKGLWVLLCVMGLVTHLAVQPLAAQEAPAAQQAAGENPELQATQPTRAPVRFRGRILFEVTAPVGELGVEARARAIEQRLLQIAEGPDTVLADLRVIENGSLSQIRAGDTLVRVVTDEDAQRTGRTRRQLAADQLVTVRAVLAEEFHDRGIAALLRASGLAAAATVALFLLAILVRKGYRYGRQRITRAAHHWHWESGLARLSLLSPATVANLSRAIVAAIAWLCVLALLYVYLEFVLSLFPWTRGIADRMVETASRTVTRILGGLVGYLPELFNIVVIVLIARFALKLVRSFFQHVASQRVVLAGFYPEWALPTYSILRFMVIAVAAVMIFPYLPGSGSEGFRGISVFIGLLVSLGAASAIANVIAGVVITYMRPFKVGDRVKIADAVGDVINKDLFVVRLRTIKNVDITIPNSLALANHIVNFSSSAQDRGLILHTSVTIGYDVPWKKVHELLLQAAKKTEGLKEEPAPFVLQTSLDDFYVSYELNAFTERPQEMAVIYSRLHAEILDAFNAAGVEIMSPHYTAVRDGARLALPDEHLPKNYRPAGFGIFTRTQRISEDATPAVAER